MYEVYYYINKLPYRYNFSFCSPWAAITHARSILEDFGLATDVMNCKTGEIIAIFEPDNSWVQEGYA